MGAARKIKDQVQAEISCPLVWPPSSGLGWAPIPSYNHIGILRNIPDKTKETRLRDS